MELPDVTGVGSVVLEFIDATLAGEYRLSLEPGEKEALLKPLGDASIGIKYSDKATTQTVEVTGPLGNVKISIPITGNPPVTIYGRVTNSVRRPVKLFEETAREPWAFYEKAILLPAGSYRLTTVVRDAGGNSVQYENAFEVK